MARFQRRPRSAKVQGAAPLPFNPFLLPVSFNVDVLDPRVTSLVTKDGSSLVSSITTQGRAIVYTQNTGANKPTYVQDIPGGNPGYLSFCDAGAISNMTFPTQSNAHLENRGVMMAFRVPAFSAFLTTATPPLFSVNGTGGSVNMRQPMLAADKNAKTIDARWVNNQGQNKLVSRPLDDNVWVLILSYIIDGVSYLRVNGVLVDKSPAGSAPIVLPPTSSGNLGMLGYTTVCPWHFGGLVLFQGEPTDDQVARLEWWGSQLQPGMTLPAGHRYAASTPMVLPTSSPAVLRVPSSRAADFGVWSTAHQGEWLDLTGFQQTFLCDFSTDPVTRGDGGLGPLFARGIADYGATASQVDATTWAEAGDAAYAVSGGKLRITARHPGSGGTNWTSGTVQSGDWHGRGFRQKYGAFRWRMSFPLATDFDVNPRKWPAAWLESANKWTTQTDDYVELDICECYEDTGWFSHATAFLHKANRPREGAVASDLLSSMYAENSSGTKLSVSGITPTAMGNYAGIINYFGVGYVDFVGVIDPDIGLRIFVNSRELARRPLTPDMFQPMIMMASLQILSDRKASDSAQYVSGLTTTTTAYIDIDEMSAYQRPDWARRA